MFFSFYFQLVIASLGSVTVPESDNFMQGDAADGSGSGYGIWWKHRDEDTDDEDVDPTGSGSGDGPREGIFIQIVNRTCVNSIPSIYQYF